MNTRTVVLLGGMMLLVVAFVADQLGLLGFLDGSGSTSESKIDLVTRKIEKAEDIIQLGVKADDTLESFEARSLPYDDRAARSEYQDWLAEVFERNGLRVPNASVVGVERAQVITVKDADKKPKEAYKRYGFSLSGIGRLEQVKQFLHDFYQAGHLHKITAMSLTPTSGGRFNVSISGEAIGIATCDRKSELTELTLNRLAEEPSAYDKIVRRNIFSREAAAVLKTIQLSSVTFDKQGLPEAWFKSGAATKRMQRGDTMEVSVHLIELIDVQPRSVLIDIDGQILDLPIGKTVYEAVKSDVELVAGSQ